MAISEADQQAIAKRWQEILTQRGAALAIAAKAPTDIRKDFCEVWPTADQILNVLKSLLPPPGQWAIAIVLAAGDAACEQLCGH